LRYRADRFFLAPNFSHFSDHSRTRIFAHFRGLHFLK
jgi:hypothetical protein